MVNGNNIGEGESKIMIFFNIQIFKKMAEDGSSF